MHIIIYMQRNKFIFIFSILFIILMLIACTKSSQSEILENSEQNNNSNSIKQDVVKIASIFAITGEAAGLEILFSEQLQFIVDVLNEKGGFLGKEIELMVYDTQSTSIGAKIAADQAVKDGVIAAIGASWSSHSIAAANVFQEAGVIMITPDSTNPKVTQIGDYIFRTCFVDTDQGRAAAHFVKKDLGFSTAAVLVNINDEYSIGLADFFEEEFEIINGEILYHGEYSHQSADFSDILNIIKELNPEVVYLPGRPTDIQLIILQSLKLGIDTTFIGGDSWNTEKIFDFCRENEFKYYFTGPWLDSEVEDLEEYRFIEKYRNQPNIDDNGYLLIYNAIIVIYEAINIAKSLNPEDIKNAIINTKSFQVYQGELTFNEYGDPIGLPTAVYTVNDEGTEVMKVLRY